MISRIQFENFNKLFVTEVHFVDRHTRDYYMIAIYLFIKLNSISISSIFKTIKCTTGTHKRVTSQECLHHFEKNNDFKQHSSLNFVQKQPKD
ncbi:hypothetical protein T02_13348 [Trichinella nativa]|uniref:Uncharacterized protein n=1 Tax=Trichinella nativa TaxID=6335 RepID=A0A0V1LG67_9BILA|nr:hypothetical protein T02_13348 [Trichinella nativa]